MDVTKLDNNRYLVDGVPRVGPNPAYATVPSSYMTRAEGALDEYRRTFSSDELNSIAHGALHVAASALTIDDPIRAEVVALLRRMEQRS